MKNSTAILNELEGISAAVAAVPKVNVYVVYDNYFDAMQKQVLATINNGSEYVVPSGYFESLTANILQKVKANDVAEELQNISKTVANIGNKNVYVVPANYFENIQFSATEKQAAKIIPFKNTTAKIAKLAAAAVVTGLLGFGIFTFVQNNVTDKNEQTAKIIKDADKIISTNSFENDFATLTDADLEKYLLQNGENVNAAMVATAAEDAELPEVMDYYLDDNTLNNFMKENNLKN